MFSFVAESLLLLSTLTALFGSSVTAAPVNHLVTVGILAQPASDPMKLQYYHPSENWTFVAGSYVDWLGTAGAMPVLIPFDISRDQLDKILDNIDGVLFPGGGAPLKKNENLNLPTGYQATMDYIMKYSYKVNDKGRYFPIYATCLGFEGAFISLANNTSILECDLDDEVVAHSVQTTPAFESSPYWTAVGLDLAKRVFETDSIYYTHECGTRVSTFQNSAILKEHLNLLASSKSKSGIEFVACVEHKKYPIIANQWHPEKNLYERGQLYQFLDRSEDATNLMYRMAVKFVGGIREKGSPKAIKDIDPLVKEYFASSRVSETLPLSFYERVYTFQRFNYQS